VSNEPTEPPSRERVDPEFRALPLTAVADAALSSARAGGAEHADVRVERIVSQSLSLRDGVVVHVADSTTVGLAVRDGLIRSVNDPVRRYISTGEFDGPLNGKITWDHLLRQTSDWEGTLWGKPDWADRPPKGKEVDAYRLRKHNEPGTSYKYNDVRVNLLALAALQVWRRPLPQVLKERIMDPIGASNTWRWLGYENSWVEVDGLKMQSVAGGGHWGGGMWISARDQARFGLLTLRKGAWKGKQLMAEDWIQQARTPTPVQPTYGYMNWYLNTDKKLWPNAPATAWGHIGNGTNIIYCDPEHDLVVVLRWIDGDAIDGFLQRLFGAIL